MQIGETSIQQTHLCIGKWIWSHIYLLTVMWNYLCITSDFRRQNKQRLTFHKMAYVLAWIMWGFHARFLSVQPCLSSLPLVKYTTSCRICYEGTRSTGYCLIHSRWCNKQKQRQSIQHIDHSTWSSWFCFHINKGFNNRHCNLLYMMSLTALTLLSTSSGGLDSMEIEHKSHILTTLLTLKIFQ